MTGPIFPMFKADFLERTRGIGFRATLCLALYIGYAVNSGQIVIDLHGYRGLYNSAWVGTLMAVVISFLLGLLGFFLVKNGIERDERTGVGQIIATTAISRIQYLVGKWLSNLAVLCSLVIILALAAGVMQIIQGEDPRIRVYSLLAPFGFIALPMMAWVAGLAVLFETVRWLKGGFGNLVYFGLFTALLFLGLQKAQAYWLDVSGMRLAGDSMSVAARAAFPDYPGGFVLAFVSGEPLQTFAWMGVDWTWSLIAQRLVWLPAALGVVLLSTLFFNRFDGVRSGRTMKQERDEEQMEMVDGESTFEAAAASTQLTPLTNGVPLQNNFWRLVWLEGRLLVKGLPWYWWLGMAGIWLGCILVPLEGLRKMGYMLAAIWPVLVWSKLGERDAHFGTEALVMPAPGPRLRRVLAPWLAGVGLTAWVLSGSLLGRLVYARAEPDLAPWALAVLFIPSLALAAGLWSRSSKLFEVVYVILWYLGPFNPQSSLAVLDFLGVHTQAPVHTAPWAVAGVVLGLVLAAYARLRVATP